VCELAEATCDAPSGTLADGALIESAPASNVKVIGVFAAEAGREAARASVAKVLARSRYFRIGRAFFVGGRDAGKARLVQLIDIRNPPAWGNLGAQFDRPTSPFGVPPARG
jgi:hypothetical protein